MPEPHPWGARGTRKGSRSVINSLYIVPEDLEDVNQRIADKYAAMCRDEVRWAEEGLDGEVDGALVAYGSAARVCRTAVQMLAKQGLRVGLFRPITLYPFPYCQLRALSERVKKLMVVEMSLGQMVEDVKLAVEGRCPVEFYGRTGGVVPLPEDVAEAFKTGGMALKTQCCL